VRRTISIGLAAVLAVGVVLTIVVSRSGSSAKHLRVVHGVTGAENERLFADNRVKAAFAKHGLDVRVDSVPSDQVMTTAEVARDDFAFLIETARAAKLAAARHATATSLSFSSPMVVATFKEVAQRLARAGIAQAHQGWWTLDTKRYLDLVRRRVHWSGLPGNTASADKRLVFISSPGVTTSEGAMYASLASYVANNGEVVRSVAQVDKIVNAVSPLFLDQGAEQTTTDSHPEHTQNVGLAPPLVWTDEADFVARAAVHAGSIRPDRVLMYPSPDVVATYALVSFTPAGSEVDQLLATDPELRQLAVEHGMRTTTQPGAMPAFARQNGVAVPVNLPKGIRLPSYDTGQALVTRVEAAVLAARGPDPASESTESIPSPVPSTSPNRTGYP
jgi:hypothetical protein